MKWSIQVVRPSTHNTASTSVLVHFDKGRYLFNCGEGIQRLSFENKVRMSRLSNIFLTRVHWETMGGLPGMLLTLADGGTQNVTVSGGHNLAHALAATRHFILRGNMGVRANEMRAGGANGEAEGSCVFRDENMNVQAVHVYPEHYVPGADETRLEDSDEMTVRHQLVARAFGEQKIEPAQTNRRKNKQPQMQQKKGYYPEKCKGASVEAQLAAAEEDARKKKRARSPDQTIGGGSGRQQQHVADTVLPPTTPTPAALCYIAEGPDVPGKFDVAAAQALGLKPGPLYGKLQRGETVQAPDGTMISPAQCVGATRPGRIFILVECPDPSYIPSVVAAPEFAPFLADPEVAAAGDGAESPAGKLLAVVHALGEGVATDKRYRDWVARFPKHVQHIVSAPELVADGNAFQRHLRIQAAMTAIDAQTYVLPQSSHVPDLSLGSFLEGANVVAAQSQLRYEVEPRPLLVTDDVPLLKTPEDMLASAKLGTLYTGESSASSAAAEDEPAVNQDIAESDMAEPLVVCPIGTGSSVPSIYRNVSANIVDIPSYGGMVLDCGESTVSQLKRFLGHPTRNEHNRRIPKTYTQFIQSLRLLYISHMHADHHLGAIQLLHEWVRLAPSTNRLTVLAPARFLSWLRDFSGVQDVGLQRIDFINCHDLRLDASPAGHVRRRVDAAKRSLGLTDMVTCSVVHCPWAYGVSLTHESGWRVVYSGDTRPCTNLVALGRHGTCRPTVLLHEATHSDDLLEDAIAKRHTTVSEAVAMAVAMRAENLLLTHFSQRCLTLPKWDPKNVRAVSVPRFGALVPAISAGTANGSGDGSGDGEMVSEYEDMQQILGPLNIAAAFDLSAYSPADIARYRRNSASLRQVMRKEISALAAEEAESTANSDDEDDSHGGDAPKKPNPNQKKQKQKRQKQPTKQTAKPNPK